MNLKLTGRLKNIRDFYRGITDSKKGRQPRTNIVNDEKCDFVTNTHIVLATCRYHFFYVFDVHGVSIVRQAKIHTSETRMSVSCVFEFEKTTSKQKRHKPPGNVQIPAESIKRMLQSNSLRDP